MLPEEGQILTGPQFSEPVRVETVRGRGPGRRAAASTSAPGRPSSGRARPRGRAGSHCPKRPSAPRLRTTMPGRSSGAITPCAPLRSRIRAQPRLSSGYASPPIGGRRTRSSRTSSKTTMHPFSRGSSLPDRLASSNSAWRSGRRFRTGLKRINDGRASVLNASKAAKSMSADTRMRSSSLARSKIASSVAAPARSRGHARHRGRRGGANP
jgi:hypothetical protein